MTRARTARETAGNLLSLALCVGLFMLFCAAGWRDLFRSLPEQAEQAYRQENYEKALQHYQEAQTRNPDSDTLAYNLGNTLYRLGRYQDAAGQFGKILEKDSTALSSQSVYNMGNSLFEMGRANNDQQMLNQALDAFKRSIINNPDDEDSKYNYELTRRLIQQQEQQQQHDMDDKKKDDKKKDDQKQDDKQQDDKQNQDQDQQQDKQQQQDNEKQKEQENKPDQQQQQQPQQQEQEQQQQQPQPQPGEMSEEEAEKILQALMQMEKDAREAEQKKKAAAVGSKGRDW